MFSKLNKIINKDNLKIIHVETKKWRDFTSTFRYNTILAEHILAYRCRRENFLSENKGNFTELVQQLTKYFPVLKEHCLKHEDTAGGSKRVPTNLSKVIQNEFFYVLVNM